MLRKLRPLTSKLELIFTKIIKLWRCLTNKQKLVSIVVVVFFIIPVLITIPIFKTTNKTKNDSYGSNTYAPSVDKYERVEVIGLGVQEACSKLKEKGWKIESVYGNTSDYKDSQISDCDKANGTVRDVSYYGDSLSLYYTYEKVDVKSTETTAQPSETVKTHYKVSESKAENFCKDKAIYSDKIDVSNLTVSDYSSSAYKETYQETGSYDKNGNYEMQYSWQGKNKANGKSVSFNCFISGSSDDAIELHWLSMSGVDLYGSAEYQSFDEDGKQL